MSTWKEPNMEVIDFMKYKKKQGFMTLPMPTPVMAASKEFTIPLADFKAI